MCVCVCVQYLHVERPVFFGRVYRSFKSSDAVLEIRKRGASIGSSLKLSAFFGDYIYLIRLFGPRS